MNFNRLAVSLMLFGFVMGGPLGLVDDSATSAAQAASAQETADAPGESSKQKREALRKKKREDALKKKQERDARKLEQKRDAFKKSVNGQMGKLLGKNTKGYLLLALEERTAVKAVNVTIAVSQGREAVVNDLMKFMFHANPTQRTYQILAVFPETPLGEKLVKGHQKKLQRFANARLKDNVFSRDACYSDLAPQSKKSINQLIREGLCVKYYPFR